jgi:hypothetical protein
MLTALTLAAQAIQIRELARRAFSIANSMPNTDDRTRLMECAEQLEEEADGLENQARSTPLSRLGRRSEPD